MAEYGIGFIGAGNMAGAIIGGLVGKGVYSRAQIAVCDALEEKQREYREKGHPVLADGAAVTAACRIVVLAVKPQMFPQVLPLVAQAMAPEKILVSIAAGITAQAIKEAVGFDCKVVLAMPNTPLLLGCGATALARVEPCTMEEFEEIKGVFACAGLAEEIPADKMNQIIPVNGSSPAFLYQFAKVTADEAAKEGIPPDIALKLVAQALIGSGKMLLETGLAPTELIRMVCSPGGSTLAGMKALEEAGYEKAIAAASAACAQRAEELAAGK